MHRLITCDDVFDVLTRGPFPTGNDTDDSDVELHLCGCHDCRQLAEALRPAAGALRESLVDDSLPAYRGTMSAPSVSHAPWLAPNPVALAQAQSQAHSGSIWVAHAARLATAAMLIAILIGGLNLVAMLKSEGAENPRIRAQLIAAPLPQLCRVALLQGVSDNAARENCCSTCHSTSAIQSAPIHQLVATSCHACHE